MKYSLILLLPALFAIVLISQADTAFAQSSEDPKYPDAIGVSAQPPEGAEVLFNGSEEMLHEKWRYWEEGERFDAEYPISWPMLEDPVDEGMVISSLDPAAVDKSYGVADIVTKEKFRDFRLHVEFLLPAERANSGVYLQNRYEIQVVEGEDGPHGLAAIINEHAAPYELFNGIGQWNAYDIVFRAARFEDGERVQKALVTMYFNGEKVHENQSITRVWGGPASGIDGDNDEEGVGITDTPGGLKLQAEGHSVLYRNIWINELELDEADTDF